MAKIRRILLFLTLLLLPTQLGRHFWPEFSFVYSLPIDYYSPTLYLWDLVNLGLFMTWIIGPAKLSQKALSLILLFIILQSLSIFAADNRGASFVRLLQYLSPSLFGLFLASQQIKSLLKELFIPLTWVVLFESGLSLFQFITGRAGLFWLLGERALTASTPGIATFNFYGQVLLRPYGTFPHPNVLAAFLVISSLVLMGYYSFNLPSTLRRRLHLTLSAAGLTILLTFSRSAILFLVISLTGFNFSKLKRVFTKGWFQTIKSHLDEAEIVDLRTAMIFGLGLLLLIPLLITRFTSLFNFDQVSLLRREELSRIALQFFRESPLVGIGLNNFIDKSAYSNLVSGQSRFLQPVHSTYLLALSETGIFGLVSLLLPAGYCLYRLIKLADPLKLSLSLSWAAVIFLGFFDHYFLTLPQGQRLFFLVLGLSLSLINSSKNLRSATIFNSGNR